MSIEVITGPAAGRTPPRPDSWSVMQARLATTKVHDLLDDAAAQLTRLAGDVDLPEGVADAVRETLQQVEAGRTTIAAARRHAEAADARGTSPERGPGGAQDEVRVRGVHPSEVVI